MTKEIYMSKLGDHVNQRLANLVINEQLLIWYKNNLCKYKKMYPTSKAWVLFESKFDSPILQQLTLSIETKINLINNQYQQSFIPVVIPKNVILDLANAFRLTLPIY